MYTKGTKYTLEQITKRLGVSLSDELMSTNVLTIGKKVFVKGENGLNAEIYFYNQREAQTYNVIRIIVFNEATQEKGNSLTINITEEKYKPSSFTRTDLNCAGHYWGYDKEFYGYVPRFELIIGDILNFLVFLGITK